MTFPAHFFPIEPTIFSVTAALSPTWDRILTSVAQTRRRILIDDPKSVNAPCQQLLNTVYAQAAPEVLLVLQSSYEDYYCRSQHDQLQIDYNRLIADIKSAK